MIYLVASILSSTSIFIIFRLAKNYSCQLLYLITINYLIASILGILFFIPEKLQIMAVKGWLPYSILVGVLFISLFFLIGYSSQKTGITITSLALKLSLIFPVLFSIVYFHEKVNPVKVVGLFLAFIAIFFTIYRKEIKKTNLTIVLLPLIIFVGGGITDSIIKLVQAIKATPDEAGLFSTFVFIFAFIIALIISFIKGTGKKIDHWHTPTLALGTALGLVNFGSLYFMINALNYSRINSSMVFALNNMSIVTLSAITGYLLFHEKLSKLNLAGLLLALVSLYLLI